MDERKGSVGLVPEPGLQGLKPHAYEADKPKVAQISTNKVVLNMRAVKKYPKEN